MWCTSSYDAKAITVFRELAHLEGPAIRAGALLRLGRNLRKEQQSRAALEIHDELDQMGATPVGGLPAELIARHARIRLLDELKRTTEVKREAGLLYADSHKSNMQALSVQAASRSGAGMIIHSVQVRLNAIERQYSFRPRPTVHSRHWQAFSELVNVNEEQ